MKLAFCVLALLASVSSAQPLADHAANPGNRAVQMWPDGLVNVVVSPRRAAIIDPLEWLDSEGRGAQPLAATQILAAAKTNNGASGKRVDFMWAKVTMRPGTAAIIDPLEWLDLEGRGAQTLAVAKTDNGASGKRVDFTWAKVAMRPGRAAITAPIERLDLDSKEFDRLERKSPQ